MSEKEIEAVMDALLKNRFDFDIEAGGRYDSREVRNCAIAVLKAAEVARNGRDRAS
jgi:hypothetical protein